MSKAGIWLDFRQAEIVLLDSRTPTQNIASEIDPGRPRGGSHSTQAWGPVEKISESAFLRRRQQQEKTYFEKIIAALPKHTELYIFGPGQAKRNLVKYLHNKPGVTQIVRRLDNVGYITHNQRIAKTRTFFKGAPRRKLPPC